MASLPKSIRNRIQKSKTIIFSLLHAEKKGGRHLLWDIIKRRYLLDIQVDNCKCKNADLLIGIEIIYKVVNEDKHVFSVVLTKAQNSLPYS